MKAVNDTYKNTNTEYFDNIISLGNRCETAFAIKAVFGTVNSTFFNWVSDPDIKSLLSFLNNPDLLFSKGMITQDYMMCKDLEFGFEFHPKIDKSKMYDENGNYIGADKSMVDLEEVKSRMTYLKNKFFNSVKSNDRNLFVLCYNSNWDIKTAKQSIEELEIWLKSNSANKDSKLMLIFEKKYYKKLGISPNNFMIIKTVNKFSHPKHADEINIKDWINIFKNIEPLYPHETNIDVITENYKKYLNSKPHKIIHFLGFRIKIRRKNQSL